MFAERGALGRMLWGRADGDIATSMRQCDGSSSHGLGTFPKFPNIPQIVKRALKCDGTDNPTHALAVDGYPSFVNWPRWNDVAHHQVHVTWLRKAYTDGLRVAVVSVVSNELICDFMDVVGLPKRNDLPLTCEDMENNLAQLNKAKDIIAQNPEWMELALSSQHAKTIVESGRLAVILAVESGDIMLPRKEGQSVAEWVRDSLKIYYDAGARSVQIVHEFTNELSGASFQTTIYSLVSEAARLSASAPQISTTNLAQAITSFLDQISEPENNEYHHIDEKSSVSLETHPTVQSKSKSDAPAAAATTTAGSTTESGVANTPTAQQLAQVAAEQQPQQQQEEEDPQQRRRKLEAAAGTGVFAQQVVESLFACPNHVMQVWMRLRAWGQKHRKNLDGYKLLRAPDSNLDYNSIGLTSVAREYVSQALALGMIVDAAHLSRPSGAEYFKMLRDEFHAPYFVSHASFTTKDEHTDYDVDSSVVHWILQTGGLLGLRTLPMEVPTYPYTTVPNDCDGSVKSFAQSYQMALALGMQTTPTSDFNGLAVNLGPRFGSPEETCAEPWLREGCLELQNAPVTPNNNNNNNNNNNTNAQRLTTCEQLKQRRDSQRAAQGDVKTKGTNSPYDVKGFASIEFTGRVFEDAKNLGLDTDPLKESAGDFVEMWNRIDHTIALTTDSPSEGSPSYETVLAAMNCWCPGCQ